MKLPPSEILKAESRTAARDMTNFDWDELLKYQDNIEQFSNYLEKLMNDALDAELEAIENKKIVNKWYKKNVGHKRFATPEKADDEGYISFIYLQPIKQIYFFDDSPISTEVVELMINRNQLQYFNIVEHQGTPHKAWTTPRNIEIKVTK